MPREPVPAASGAATGTFPRYRQRLTRVLARRCQPQAQAGVGRVSEPQEHRVEPDQAQSLAVELAHLAKHVGLLDPLDDPPVVDPDVVEHGLYLAQQIRGAAYVELDDKEHIPTAAFAPKMLAHMIPFLEDAAARDVPEPDKVLATVLFSDIVGSTARAAELGDVRWRELLAEHHARVRRQLARFRGVEIDTAGDGFFARFDGPARGIRCALAIREAMRDLGLEVRIGLHAGECEMLDGKVAGIAVSIGARISAQAAADQVLVSQTVKNLVTGSGITFEDRGSHELKGVPGEWRLYSVVSA